MDGLFITFEGPDGGGKSTQVRLLADRLGAAGYPVTVSREPGGTALGERVREMLLQHAEPAPGPATEAFLVCAARCEHVAQVIRPALAAGRVVVCDRFTDATLAYQGFGGGVSLSLLGRMNHLATGGLAPDQTLLLDLPVEEGLARRQRGNLEWTRLDAADARFHERVRQGYRALALQDPQRWVVIDATPGAEAVAEIVWEAVGWRLEAAGDPARPQRRSES